MFLLSPNVGFLILLLSILFSYVNTSLVEGKISPSSAAPVAGKHDEYSEQLTLKPLDDGKLFALFQFKTLYRKDLRDLRWENKFEIFPLTIADLIATSDLTELHFSLTKGNWNYRNWGYPVRPSPPGAEIRVLFSKHNENPERSWKRLVKSLAGKFCASLASADVRSQVQSMLNFDSSLDFNPSSMPTYGHQSQHQNLTKPTYYSNLAEETLCTENLTPWRKLLPCYTDSGLASLLNAVKLFKSSYSSMALDVESVPCKSNPQNIDCEQVQLTQTINIVFNPISVFEGKHTWSLVKLFGQPVRKTCPVASISKIHVDITKLDDIKKIYPATYDNHEVNITHLGKVVEVRKYATFDINALMVNETTSTKGVEVNLGIKETKLFKRPAASSRPTIPVYLKTHVAGVGSGDGTIVATIDNNLGIPIRLTYMDVIPLYLRVYLHTLTIRTRAGLELKPDKLNFVLPKESGPTLIEFSLIVPANTEAQISYNFEKVFLRWTDYKPDANKGILLSSASIAFKLSSQHNFDAIPPAFIQQVFNVRAKEDHTAESYANEESSLIRVYARPLLIILPTPDFSMPYNVICLVCSVLVVAFGHLHSFSTKKPILVGTDERKQESEYAEDQDEESKKNK